MNIVLDKDAYIPVKAHEDDAGYDLFAKSAFIIPKHEYAIHDTGVHIQIPKGYVGFLKSKSGLNIKHNITGEGVIDSGYTGSIVVKLYNHGNENYSVNKGDKIIQLVILPIFSAELIEVTVLDDTERGANGFGSTGK